MTSAEVLINLPSIKFNNGYWYSVPEILELEVQVGKRVLVELGNKKTEGFVINIIPEGEKTDLKPILKVLDKEQVFDRRLLDLAGWMAEYYVCPVSSALNVMLPRLLSKKKSRAILPLISQEEFYNQELETNTGITLMEKLWSEGEITVRSAMKYINQNDLDKLVSMGLVIITGSYQASQQYRNGYVYKPGDFDYDYVITAIKKNAARQAEIIEMIYRSGEVDCNKLDSIFPRTSIKCLLKKGFITIEKKYKQLHYKPLTLTEEQEKALDIINIKIDAGNYAEILLHGVTGSGKTEIYIRSAERVIKQGKGVIILVPEIALTRHLVSSFNTRFKKIAVLHSAMPPTERYDEWKRIKNGEIDLVLGTRSAIYAPLPYIGLIVIDEEQETTYKQEETPRYHAREVAAQRAQADSAVLLMGSATPSIDTFYKAMKGDMALVSLLGRIGDARLPSVTVEDMKQVFQYGTTNVISPYLMKKIKQTIERGEQTILFINRRGYAPITICMQCGHIASCPDCSVALTYHMDIGCHVCHYCDYRIPVLRVCTICGSSHIQQIGFGTQKVEEAIQAHFPEARISRLDMDTSRRKGTQTAILDNMKSKKVDILIGTQMVAKGLDFPAVSLVGIIDADGMLNLPDFRAAERCFQLIVQAAGRAGRGSLPGEVVIQTYSPDNQVIQMAARQNYFGFYQEEIKLRKLLHYPPFTNLLRIVISADKESELQWVSQKVADYINEIVDAREDDIDVLGPAPCPISKIRNRYRYQVIVKSDSLLLISSIAKYIILSRSYKNTRLELDINPVMTM